MGTIEPARLLKLMTERKFEDVSKYSAGNLALKRPLIKQVIQLIDFILTMPAMQKCWLMRKSEDPVLIKLINMLIDTANIEYS